MSGEPLRYSEADRRVHGIELSCWFPSEMCKWACGGQPFRGVVFYFFDARVMHAPLLWQLGLWV